MAMDNRKIIFQPLFWGGSMWNVGATYMFVTTNAPHGIRNGRKAMLLGVPGWLNFCGVGVLGFPHATCIHPLYLFLILGYCRYPSAEFLHFPVPSLDHVQLMIHLQKYLLDSQCLDFQEKPTGNHVFSHANIHAKCMYICMHVCIYICTYLYMYVYIVLSV
jgi:hypothetical protein